MMLKVNDASSSKIKVQLSYTPDSNLQFKVLWTSYPRHILMLTNNCGRAAVLLLFVTKTDHFQSPNLSEFSNGDLQPRTNRNYPFLVTLYSLTS